MQSTHSMRTRLGSAILALLLLVTAMVSVTACQLTGGGGGADTTENTVTDANGSPTEGTSPTGDTTLGENTDPAGDETADPGETIKPYDKPLIGDGLSTAGVFPTFSVRGGLYTEGQSVCLQGPEGYTVRYTTNGSIPTNRSKAYKSPIQCADGAGKSTVIRAACFDESGKLSGQVITQTYVCVEKTTALTYTVMLTTDKANLDEMYASPAEKIEHAGHAEIIAPDGTRVISQDVGIRLFGGSSRNLQQKSFKIVARKDGYFGDTPYVGAGTFTYPFFSDRIVQAGKNAGEVLEKYDSLILRNGGNDSLLSTAADPMDTCLLRDGLANRFAFRYAKNLPSSLAHFATVYLNGQYYGILELRENQNEDYFKRIWGVDDNDIVVVKSELDTSRKCDDPNGETCKGGGCRFCGVWFYYETDEEAAAQAEMQAWIDLCRRAAAAVHAGDAEYNALYKEISEKVDLVNVKEYLALSTFLCNTDWPYNNIRVWRYTGAAMDGVSITDGKWRFATRDMDMSMARYSSPDMLPDLDSRTSVDMFDWVLGNYIQGYDERLRYNDALYLQGLFAFLLRNDAFRADFAAFCRELTSDEATAYFNELYADGVEQLKPIMRDHIDRWEGAIAHGYQYRDWNVAASRVKSFIRTRPGKFIEHMEKMLALYA